jgi:magnesium-transporting ATPase (P-type)
LFFAMALSYGTKDFIEGGVITAVIALNVLIGFWQEYNALVSPAIRQPVKSSAEADNSQ